MVGTSFELLQTVFADIRRQMPGPTGIFVGETQATLDEIRVDALAQITSGRRTSISGGGKSGSKEYSMSAQDILREVVYAEQQNGTRSPRAAQVVQALNAQWPPTGGGTVSMQTP